MRINQTITDRQDASLKLFFREVSKLPLISQEEEIELAKRIANGDQAAAHKLVEANLRFVISVAKQYQNKGLALVDLIQAGVEGLLQAVYKWDYTKGFKFISYAVWWIRQSILQALTFECRTIRIPTSQVVTMTKIKKVIDKFEQENLRSPTDEELSEELNIDSLKVNTTKVSFGHSVSLDSTINEDGQLYDIVPAENNFDSDFKNEYLSKAIFKVLDKLNNREHDVLCMYFGINMEEMSPNEIGCRFGVGEERCRQIIKEALEKIRMYYIDDLKEFV